MKKVQLDKLTGEEVKHLLEQNSSSGVIETLPDVIAFFQGIGTDETIEEYIKRIVGTLDVVPPDSVGTEQIIDDSVKMEDLNTEVKDKIRKTYVQKDETLYMDFDEQVSTAPTVPTTPIIVEEEEEP